MSSCFFHHRNVSIETDQIIIGNINLIAPSHSFRKTKLFSSFDHFFFLMDHLFRFMIHEEHARAKCRQQNKEKNTFRVQKNRFCLCIRAFTKNKLSTLKNTGEQTVHSLDCTNTESTVCNVRNGNRLNSVVTFCAVLVCCCQSVN